MDIVYWKDEDTEEAICSDKKAESQTLGED